MKSKKVKGYIIVILCLVLLTAAGVYAATTYQLAYVEKFETSKVDIQIQEISATAEGETVDSMHIVEANQDVSYIPRIINNGADCYIRAQIDVEMDGQCQQPLTEEHIYGLSEEWICKGDYFYYTKVLSENQQTDLFKGLHIPEDWDYGESDGFTVSVKAEAVQSANFAPDFNVELPWGAVELTEVTSVTGSTCMEAVPVNRISDVEYISPGGFQCATEDLFDEFRGMMPGDICEKTVKLKNATKGSMKVSLKIDAEESFINEKMHLQIECDEKEVYSGTIADASDLTAIEVTEIPKKEIGMVTMRLAFPADADNSYSNIEDDVVWELMVDEVPDDSAQTGDLSNMLPYFALAIITFVLMMYLAMHRRKGTNGTSHQIN